MDERLAWRDALARHVLSRMRSRNGNPLSNWKMEEQLVPMSLAVATLIEEGVLNPQAIEEQLCSDGATRNGHACSE